jgi:hypothetical protein
MNRSVSFRWIWLLLITVPGCTTPPSARFIVSPNGADSGPGTVEAPCATVERVRCAVLHLRDRGFDRDVVVLVRGGTYLLEEPLIFGPEDGGNADHAVRYEAWPGETPVFSGGRAITAFRQAEQNRWSADVPETKAGDGSFRQLLVNGRRTSRARYPNLPNLITVRNVSVLDDQLQPAHGGGCNRSICGVIGCRNGRR